MYFHGLFLTSMKKKLKTVLISRLKMEMEQGAALTRFCNSSWQFQVSKMQSSQMVICSASVLQLTEEEQATKLVR